VRLPNVTVWELPGADGRKKENPHECMCKSMNTQWFNKKRSGRKIQYKQGVTSRHVFLFLSSMLKTQRDILFV